MAPGHPWGTRLHNFGLPVDAGCRADARRRNSSCGGTPQRSGRSAPYLRFFSPGRIEPVRPPTLSAIDFWTPAVARTELGKKARTGSAVRRGGFQAARRVPLGRARCVAGEAGCGRRARRFRGSSRSGPRGAVGNGCDDAWRTTGAVLPEAMAGRLSLPVSSVTWLSPLPDDDFAECRDGPFLNRLGERHRLARYGLLS